MRYGVTARRKRNVRRVAGLQALRQARRDYRRAAGKAEIVATEAETSGTLVIEAKGIGKSFGARTIVKDLSVRVMRGDRIGVVGPNGSGKTTLVGLLTGSLAPDSGSIRLGANLAMANLDQGRESLDPGWTLSEALTGGRGNTVTVGGQTKHVVGYMQDFLFSPQQARTALSALSGGERGRLMLARALAKPSNLLVLDEPTNDLDLETLDVLEEMLGAYAGTVILISHDRDFLDRVVNLVLAPDGDGRWTEYAGGYSDMLAQRGADLGSRKVEKAKLAAPAKSVTSPAAAPASKRKLSFKEKHALETLPKEIATLQAKICQLQQRFDDPALYSRDPKAFAETSASLAAAQSQLAAAEERWLELEMLREEIEGG
jgi:ATP-binding cassette subfamily F protein uup